jgi:ribosomal protein S18 acetylase RimI-like enzyme
MNEVRKLEYKSASANLTITRSGKMFLGSVVAHERRKGHATELLRIVCKTADTAGAEVKLTVEVDTQSGDPDSQSLIRFYEKFGFKSMIDDNPYYMTRSPKPLS